MVWGPGLWEVEGVRGSRRCRGGGVQFYRLKLLPDSNCIVIKFKMLIHYPKNLSGSITTIMHYNWNTDHHSALQLIQFIAIVEFGQRGQQYSYCPMRYDYFLNVYDKLRLNLSIIGESIFCVLLFWYHIFN